MAAAGPVAFDPGQLILDHGTLSPGFLFPDKVGNSAVFANYGQNAWAPSGSYSYQNIDGVGISLAKSQSVGGITSVCDPTGLTGCADFGARAGVSASGGLGLNYGLRLDGGTLDLRYPVQVTLDLPYGPAGSGIPRIGDTFTIGSSWKLQTFNALKKPFGDNVDVSPLLASHGPELRAFVDLLAQGSVGASGKVCVGGCIGGGASIGFYESQELASVNRNGDGVTRVLGNSVSKGTPGQLLGGAIQYYLNAPSLDAKGVLGADLKTLSAKTSDEVMGIGIGIDELITLATGIPLHNSFGINIAGKHLGVGYNLLQADAWLDMLLAQRIGFVANPIVELLFSSPVQRQLADGSFSPLSNKITFNAGDSVTLRAPGAKWMGVIPSFGLTGVATNKLDLDFKGSIDVTALGLTSTIGDLGPLVDESLSAGLGSINVADESFFVNMGRVDGGAFNMAFLPWEKYETGTQTGVLSFWDPSQWGAPGDDDYCDREISICRQRAQQRVQGFYDFAEIGAPDCLFDPDGCSAEAYGAFFERVAAVNAGRDASSFMLSGSRLMESEGFDVYFNDLLALTERALFIEADADLAVVAGRIADFRSRFADQLFVVPPAPVPAPGTLALSLLALLTLACCRRTGGASDKG